MLHNINNSNNITTSVFSYTEEHLMILWSLTVKIITDHSQHLKYILLL